MVLALAFLRVFQHNSHRTSSHIKPADGELEAGVWKEEIKDVALGMMPHGLGRRNPSKRNWPKMGQRQDTGQSTRAPSHLFFNL